LNDFHTIDERRMGSGSTNESKIREMNNAMLVFAVMSVLYYIKKDEVQQ